MAWIDDAKVIEILGDTKPWFIHPAGMMGLVGGKKTGFIFTLDVMKRIYINFQGNNSKDHELQGIADELNEHIEFYQLDTPLKRTHFFAQILQETGPDLNVIEGGIWRVSAIRTFQGGRTRRYPDGRLYADVHGYVTKTERPRRYIKSDGNDVTIDDQIAIVNTIYGNRTELGNGPYNSNDGWNYRGRGLKQVTGKSNYTSFNNWHKRNQSKWPDDVINAVDDFEILSQMKFATRSAAWFWISNSSNENPDASAKCFDYANEASDAAVDKITNIINLNTNSRQQRKNNFWRLWNEEVLHDQ